MGARNWLADSRLVLASVAAASSNADIEDLFTEGDYLELFNATFSTSLKVGSLFEPLDGPPKPQGRARSRS